MKPLFTTESIITRHFGAATCREIIVTVRGVRAGVIQLPAPALVADQARLFADQGCDILCSTQELYWMDGVTRYTPTLL